MSRHATDVELFEIRLVILVHLVREMAGVPLLRPPRFHLQEETLRGVGSRKLFNVGVDERIFGLEGGSHSVEGRRILGNVTAYSAALSLRFSNNLIVT